jgi:chemotaxis protein histidine kinase CheA
VYGIVKQFAGYVDVDSAPGRGSTFNVYLPRYSQIVAAVGLQE